MVKRRFSLVVAGAAAALLAVAGCSDTNGGTGGDAERERPTIVYGIGATQITAMDPTQAVQPLDRVSTMMIFDGLVRYHVGDVSAPFEPGIAEAVPEPEMDGDTQTWTIRIRDDVVCPAGRHTEAYQLTADDVAYSLNRAADPDRSNFAVNYAAFDTVEVVDESTVRVIMSTPQSPTAFLPLISNWGPAGIVCMQAVEAEGDEEFAKYPVGTGPFMLDSYTPSQSLKLVANDDYYLGEPLAAGWEFRFISDDAARQAALLSGDLDAADAGAGDGGRWLDQVDAHDGLKAVATPIFGTWYFLFNTEHEPLDDVRVRQAISHAINRDEIIAVTGENLAFPTKSVVDSALPGGIPSEHVEEAGLEYEFDLDRARALLAEAGHEGGGFSLDIVSPNAGGVLTYYEIVQAQLKEIGVTVNIETVDTATWQQRVFSGSEPFVVSLVAFRPTPQVTFGEFFHSDSMVVGGARPAQNFSFYGGADDLIEQAGAETDPDRQQELWQQIGDKLLDDVVVKPLMVTKRAYGAVDGFTLGGTEPAESVPGNWQAGHDATIRE
ncbi:ABC transporter substrate-binding protein [Phytoactinopolyspora limicola]|uniref:ABC transporter substrate-binding protein n=1 Tax=Phytoactinopolyspora limicola TaxID=2715536 RepID=UPI00140DB57C|nr:ABC transporter substrate-binding protein [Phytoactinopolyspora limicola]